MKTQIILALLITSQIFSLNIVGADLIMQGYKYVPIDNTISNIQDFPDHYFISAGKLGNRASCPITIVNDTGLIPTYYKFCEVSVYAVKKSDLLAKGISPSNLTSLTSIKEYSELEKLLESVNATKVAEGISSHLYTVESDSRTSISQAYIISLDKVSSKPSTNVSERDYTLTYIFSGISFLALVLILVILFNRRVK